MTFATFHDAYLHHLRLVNDEPEFENAPRGMPSREVLGVAFRIADPVQRLVLTPARRTNVIFNYAEALWYLSGRRDLEFITYYAPSIAKYSADGLTLAGTAYGPRIFRYGADRVDQWANVVQLLHDDPDSKRAVFQIYDANELAVPGNIDVACTLALQFLLRDGRLHAVAFMRANDAFRGIVSDVFSFTLIQEVLARQLGVDVGSYTHMVGSFHLYEQDRDWAREVLADCSVDVDHKRVPEMPAGDNWSAIRCVLEYEEQLRRNQIQLDGAAIASLALPSYWQWVVALLELQRRRRHDVGGSPGDLMEAIPEPLRTCVCLR